MKGGADRATLVVRGLRRIYRALLRFHPRAVREEYGQEMWEAVTELERETAAGAARYSLVRFWLEEDLALLRSLLEAHREGRRHERGSDHGTALLFRRSRLRRRAGSAEPFKRLARDLRHGARQLWRRPAFAVTTSLTLALGIGATTAIFSVIDGVLFEVFPAFDAERLVYVWERNLAQGGNNWELAPADFEDYRARGRALEVLGGYGYPQEFTYLPGLEPRIVRGLPVSLDFFTAVGANPLFGRGFIAGEDDPEARAVVVLSYGFWHAELGGDSNVLGRTVRLDDEVAEVVGVMPPGFHVQTQPVDFWFPVWVATDQTWSRSFHYWYGVGRLSPGATVEEAEADLLRIAHELEREHPETNQGHLVNVIPLREAIIGEIRPALLLLMGVVGLVLLIACSNVVNMSLVQATQRRREMSVRSALGAARWDLVRVALSEALIVATLGGVAGVALAGLGTGALVRLIPLALPGWSVIELDGSVLAFSAVVTLVVALFLGLAPGLSLARVSVGGALKEAGRWAGAGQEQRRSQRALLVVQLALAVLLSIGAGLMMRSLQRLQAVDLGARIDGVLTADIPLPDGRYSDHATRLAFWNSLVERVEGLPWVSGASATSALPIRGGGFGSALTTEADDQPEVGARPAVRVRYVHTGLFDALGVPIVEGRRLSADDGPEGPLVALINATMARRFWPEEGAVGSRFKLGSNPDDGPWIEIVGVIRDVKEQGIKGETLPAVYLANTQSARRVLKLVVRTEVPPVEIVPLVRETLREIDPEIPLHDVQSMTALAGAALARERSTTLLLGLFAVVATTLAALGVFGVVAYGVARRGREIAVRIALGAHGMRILKTVVGEVFVLATIAIGVGLLLSLGLTRVLRGLLYEVSATDPATFASIPALLLGVALAAAFLPARRAAGMGPARILQEE